MHPSIDASTACWSEALQAITPIEAKAREINNIRRNFEEIKVILSVSSHLLVLLIALSLFESSQNKYERICMLQVTKKQCPERSKQKNAK